MIVYNMRQPPMRISPALKPIKSCARGSLKGVSLAINYNWSFYASMPILKKFCGGVFGKIVFYGNGAHAEVTEGRGFYGYECDNGQL